MTTLYPILACATCYGDPTASMTQGMNMAILTMLGVTGVVLGGVVGMMVCFLKRGRREGVSAHK